MYAGVRIKTILTLTLILTFLHVSILIVIKRFIYSNILIEPYHCDVMLLQKIDILIIQHIWAFVLTHAVTLK